MDQFGNDEYQALLKVQQGPAVSIYFPAQRLDNKGKNNQLAFRAQVRLARALLAERYEPQEYRDIDIMMDARLEDGEFWGSLTQGVAAFLPRVLSASTASIKMCSPRPWWVKPFIPDRCCGSWRARSMIGFWHSMQRTPASTRSTDARSTRWASV